MTNRRNAGSALPLVALIPILALPCLLLAAPADSAEHLVPAWWHSYKYAEATRHVYDVLRPVHQRVKELLQNGDSAGAVAYADSVAASDSIVDRIGFDSNWHRTGDRPRYLDSWVSGTCVDDSGHSRSVVFGIWDRPPMKTRRRFVVTDRLRRLGAGLALLLAALVLAGHQFAQERHRN